jgi:hypothetical protein
MHGCVLQAAGPEKLLLGGDPIAWFPMGVEGGCFAQAPSRLQGTVWGRGGRLYTEPGKCSTR